MKNIFELILVTTFWTLPAYYILRKISRHLNNTEKVHEEESIQPNIRWHYRHKDFLMTTSENKFFDVINQAVGDDFYVFPQIHLSAIMHSMHDEYGRQNANRLSVDYVICDKQYKRPLLAIELDDRTHDSDKRKQRDANVKQMLEEARVPLLRFRDLERTSDMEIILQIRAKLPQPKTGYSLSQH